MATQSKNLSAAQIEARRKNSCKSTGPRTCRGKRHSRRNAFQHGLYSDVQFFFWDAALELGEDPGDFMRLFRGLMDARQPADTLEQVLVEEIAVLIWKKARLERSESAVQVCNVRKHDLERRKQYMQVGRDVSTVSQSEVLEKGLRVTCDAPGKFEKLLAMLGMLEEMAERNEFTYEMHRLLRALYGAEPTLRGAGLFNTFLKLEKLPPEGQEFEDAKTLFKACLAEESSDVLGEYELFLHEHVENTRAARMAAMAPSHAQWAAIIRQQNALHRQLERKIRLLDEMQERRRKAEASELLARLAAKGEPQGRGPQTLGGGTPASNGQAPTTPNPSSPEEGSRWNLASAASGQPGVAHTSRRLGSGCMRLPPPLRQERDADMPEGGTSPPPASGAEENSPGREPTTAGGRVREELAGAEKTQNRGNEAKESLKTKEVARTMCAQGTHSGARKAPNEAKKGVFRCKRGRSGVGKLTGRPGCGLSFRSDMGSRPTPRNENHLRRRPRAGGGPSRVQWIPAFAGMTSRDVIFGGPRG